MNRAPEAGAFIVAQGLTRHFGRRAVVRQLNLAIERGEIFGLVGPDGAGKTTTLRLLTGLLRPTAGTAWVAGYDIRREAEAIKRRVGYMSQQFSLYGDLTVLENLRFFADIYQVPAAEREERLPRLLGFSRLERFGDRRAGRLSGGMQKKLALACTLIHQPEIIYLDEPTTGVDPVSRREFWDILSELHVQGMTMVVSTPYMDEAERCSRVGLMFQGQLIACDTPAAIQRRVAGQLLELLPDRLTGAVEVLRGQPGVLEIQTYGDLLHLFVDDAEQRAAELQAALTAAGYTIHWMRHTTPRMEEAFIHLIGQQAAGARPVEEEG